MLPGPKMVHGVNVGIATVQRCAEMCSDVPPCAAMCSPWYPWQWDIRLVTRALLSGEEAVGALVRSLVTALVGALPALILALLGLGFARTFGVHLEPTFAPVLA